MQSDENPEEKEDGDAGYRHEFRRDGATVEVDVHRDGNNAFVRWRTDGRSGEHGAVHAGELVLNFPEFVTGEEAAETVELPEHVLVKLREDLGELREEITDGMSQEEMEREEEDRKVFERAREIIESSDVPEPSEYEPQVFEPEDAPDGAEVEAVVEPHNGVAEISVEVGGNQGYSPHYDLSENRMTLPGGRWNVNQEVEIPEDVALRLLSDLRSLQEELNERRRAYDDAVKQARDEVL